MKSIQQINSSYDQALATTQSHYQLMVDFVKAQMTKDIDYGVIPGTSKPTLLKPGFHYHYRCSLYRNGEMVGEGDGCCNSMEGKYQRQKNRIYDLTNTVCKMAQKRSMIAAVLASCGASQFFSQDLEDL